MSRETPSTRGRREASRTTLGPDAAALRVRQALSGVLYRYQVRQLMKVWMESGDATPTQTALRMADTERDPGQRASMARAAARLQSLDTSIRCLDEEGRARVASHVSLSVSDIQPEELRGDPRAEGTYGPGGDGLWE